MKLKKLAISFLLVLLIVVSLLGTVSAANVSVAAPEAESGVARAEETEWYYRVNNGVLEKRLWSITYGKWLTEWEPVYS